MIGSATLAFTGVAAGLIVAPGVDFAAVARNAAVAPVSPEAWLMYLLKRLAPSATARINRWMAERFEKQIAAAKPGG